MGGKGGSHTPHKDPHARPDQVSVPVVQGMGDISPAEHGWGGDSPAALRWGWQGGRAAGPAAGTWGRERAGDGGAGAGSVRGDVGAEGPVTPAGGRARGGERRGQRDSRCYMAVVTTLSSGSSVFS